MTRRAPALQPLVLLFALLVAGCAGAPVPRGPGEPATTPVSIAPASPGTGGAEEIPLPRPTGPYAVGRVALQWVDASRPEPFTDDPTDHRQVVAHAWYPAERSAAPPAPYVDRIEDTDLFRRSYGFVGFDRIRRVRTHAVDGARLADAHRRYPVILFSHGLGSVSALYSTFHENLASHGYVVVGVDHPYFSAAMRLPDGRVVMNESRRPWPGPGATAEQQAELVRIRDEEAVVQAQDLRFVLDRLEALNVKHPDGRFAGRLDLDHVGAFGHSRGGFAAPHACYLDGRFDACLNLDGYPLTNAVMAQGIRQPYMHIEETSGPEPTDEELLADHTTREQYRREVEQELREQQATFSRMKSGMYHVLVTGARHTSFTDGPFIAPDTARNVRINAGRALEITNAYLLAFFDRTLRGRRTRLLDGVSPQFPEVRLEVNRPGRPREVFQGKEAE